MLAASSARPAQLVVKFLRMALASRIVESEKSRRNCRAIAATSLTELCTLTVVGRLARFSLGIGKPVVGSASLYFSTTVTVTTALTAEPDGARHLAVEPLLPVMVPEFADHS